MFRIIIQFCFIDHTCFIAAHRFKHLGQAHFSAFLPSCQHWSTADHNRRNIQPCCCHQHSRYDLITIRNQNQTIKPVGLCHGFYGITDQFPAGKGIFHPSVSHGYPVTHTDSRYQHRHSPCHPDSIFCCLCQLIQMGMSRYDLTECADYPDQRPVQFLVCITQGIK